MSRFVFELVETRRSQAKVGITINSSYVDRMFHFFKCFKRNSTAPIVVSKHVQNIQLLFKTLINFLQKCFESKLKPEDSEKCEKNLNDMYESISVLVDQKKGYSKNSNSKNTQIKDTYYICCF